ncbi:MAG TPA: asparagine synthase-related protein, partial [Burkholderiales bacterium]|nr:asparagine synthase-related protein [Burkholderiales bacterium]
MQSSIRHADAPRRRDMSGICGWTAFNGDAPARSVLERMAARLARFGGGDVSLEWGAAASVAAAAPSHGATVYRSGQDLVAIHGHIRVADPALAERADRLGLPAALLETFRASGHAFLATLRGRFALALILAQDRKALLAVDRVSVCPLSFSRVAGGVVFASDPASINFHPHVSCDIDPQQIFNYLYFHMIPGPASIYRQQTRLAPGGYVQIDGSNVETGSYWEPTYTREQDRLAVADLKDEFRTVLRDSVRHELGAGAVGNFLSGGTDSSTVAGVVGELTGQPARTYSIGFDAEGYDETYYAHLASRHFGTVHREYRVTPADVVDAIPRIAEIHAEPFGNSSAVPTYYCAQLAHADGVTRMLAGDGGDELFGGNSRYATQYLFSLYSDLPRGLRHGVIEPLIFSVPAGDRVPLLRKVRSYIRQASIPMPARLETYNLLERLGAANIFTPDFLAAVRPDQPLALLQRTYTDAHAQTMINRMLALDFKFTLADNDLPKVNKSADLAGVEVGYPLLSDELIDFAARLPVRLKLRGTHL